MTDKSKLKQIAKIIELALLEQDSITYHGRPSNCRAKSESTAEKILALIESPSISPLNIRWHTPTTDKGMQTLSPVWPADWPIPRVGDSVYMANGEMLKVSAIDWFPYSEDAGDSPFIYIVLKKHRIGDRY